MFRTGFSLYIRILSDNPDAVQLFLLFLPIRSQEKAGSFTPASHRNHTPGLSYNCPKGETAGSRQGFFPSLPRRVVEIKMDPSPCFPQRREPPALRFGWTSILSRDIILQGFFSSPANCFSVIGGGFMNFIRAHQLTIMLFISGRCCVAFPYFFIPPGAGEPPCIALRPGEGQTVPGRSPGP